MDWTRRRILGAAAVTTAIAGCLGGDDGTDGDDGDESESVDSNEVIDWDPSDRSAEAEDRIEEYELADLTGQETAEITVDPDAGSFDPAGFVVDSQMFVEWTWTGDSEAIYPIAIPEECEWRGQGGEFSAGDSWDRLFWAPGAYIYGTRVDGEELTGAFRVRGVDESDSDEAGESAGDEEADESGDDESGM